MTTTPNAETQPVLAWHGNPQLKADTVARMRAHREADTFLQGAFAQVDADAARKYRGCFHGCLTTEALAAEKNISVRKAVIEFGQGFSPADWHAHAERLFGIPQPLGRLLDATFEGLPVDRAGAFAVAVTEAIPVGADLSMVVSRLLLDLLVDDTHGMVAIATKGSNLWVAVDVLAALYRRLTAGENVTGAEWREARLRASASLGAGGGYAASATYACGSASADAYAYAYEAAHDAAYAYSYAYEAAHDAAYAYSYADRWSGGNAAELRQEHRSWQSERLIVHILCARVPALAAAAP